MSVLIQLAYDVRDFQVEGLPAWAKADEFDVNARAEGDENFERMRLMLQTLLADRFGLKVRRDARELPVYEVEGLPAWAKADEFDVNARAEGDENFERMRLMLQTLLADRFGLKVRRDARELPVYEMEVSKAGLKLVPEKDGGCVARESGQPAPPVAGHPAPLRVCGGVRVRLSGGEEDIEAVALTMPKLAEMLAKEVNRSVIDKTGFTQPFDLKLHFIPEDGSYRLAPGIAPSLDAAGGPASVSIFTALQEQLGLRLQAARGSVPVLVIEHVAKPTEN